MEISEYQFNQGLGIKIGGRLDASNSGDFEAKLIELYNSGADNILFDVSDLDYISSAGLRVFMLAWNSCNEHDKRIALLQANDIVAEVFEISGLSDLIPAVASIDAAVEYFNE